MPERILIIRLSAMGDIVMASPLIDALRARRPDAYLAWLVQPEFAPLLRDHPGLDEVIVWPRRPWGELWRARRYHDLWRSVQAFRDELRRRQFALVFDMQGLLKSALFAWLSGAPRRIGLDSREGSGRLMTEVVSSTAADGGLIGSEYRHLAGLLGLDTDRFAMRVGIGEAARRAVAQRLAQTTPPIAVICPFTTRPQKHWTDDHWIDLARRLRRELGASVLMLGGPGDTAAARAIAGHAPVHNLVGETDLQEAAEVIRRAACLVGVDTGLTHLGTAFGIPTVALFGSTRPYLRTDSPRTRVIFHALTCAPCRRRPTCGGAFTCMTGITPDEVLRALRPLLEAA
ncbi:MAG: lipopolysaccharide heptosyltransferase I [Gammaproteobacteria bacterium]